MSDGPLPKCCEECGNDGTLVLTPSCHPGVPLFVSLTGDVLTMECAKCGLIIGRLRVTGTVRDGI